MKNKFYFYNKEELLTNPKLPLQCMEDNAAVFKTMAHEMVEIITKNNASGKHTVMICPVGPVGQYPYFVDLINEQKLSLKNVWFINMDEYLTDEKEWVSLDHPLSFRAFMNRTVYEKIDADLLMPLEQRVFPDPQNIDYIPNLIARLGGVDACFGGIGINGHVAFNEADAKLTNEEFLQLKTRILPISEETRVANAIGDFNGALEEMPQYCVTIGMYEISQAKRIHLGCFRNWHRAVVRRTAHGEASSAFPVSLLQNHPNLTLSFTEFVARLHD